MKKNLAKRIYLFFIIVLLIFISITCLAGCQSTDKNKSYFNTAGIKNTNFQYNSTKNQTKVTWTTTLTNDTIYNFNGFSVKFNLYKESKLIKTETYHYGTAVKHGDYYTGNFYFYAENEIDSIEYVAWTADYDSFWKTYKIWFIVIIAIVGVASLVYIIIMIIKDLELGDIGDFLSENKWVFLSFLAPLSGTIWGVATFNWVPILIIVGGIVAFILICLLAHLVEFIVGAFEDNIGFSGGLSKRYDDATEDEEYFDLDKEKVEDYIDDREKLMLFRVEQLKQYCRATGIKGYSALNKSNIVDLIVDNSDCDSAEASTQNNNQSISKQSDKINFEDIAGLEDAKRAFKEKVVYAFEHKDLYERYGKKVGGGLLLYGLPGTGKTMFAEAASNETASLFIPIKCSDIKSKWYGESEANVKKIFDKARKAKKAIIFFDEFEAIGAKRTDNGDNGNNDLVPQILAEMQGIGSNNANSIIMVIAATNKPWAIDSAFLRPGRFDEKIYIPLPDLGARKKLFELKLKTVPQENLNFEYLASITDGFNGADIGAFCDKLKMLAINKSIANNVECPITMDEVMQAQDLIKSSVSKDDIERLLAFRDQYR